MVVGSSAPAGLDGAVPCSRRGVFRRAAGVGVTAAPAFLAACGVSRSGQPEAGKPAASSLSGEVTVMGTSAPTGAAKC